MEVVQNKALLLTVKNPHKITAVIPKSAVIEQGVGADGTGRYKVLVNFGLEEAQVLKNIGIKNVPSPILYNYKWPGMYAPFAHQRSTASFLSLHRRAYCFNEQGTGKTAAIAWASDYLLSRRFIRRVLIICPLSIMESAWKQDLFKILMHRKVDVAYGNRNQRKDIIRSDAEYVIINYDGVELVKEELANGGFDLVVIDEANAIKTHTTKRWKAINSIITPDTWVWMATGTPASQAPVDAYGLAKMLNPSSVSPYFYSFRDSVMWKVTQFKWRPKINAAETVNKLLQPAIRFTKEECLDLPELLFADRNVPLTPQQRKYYQQLKDQFIMTAASETVTSVNAATNMNKLLQVSAGAVYTDNGNVVEFDVSDRYKELKDIIDEASHKSLVFVPFKHTINLLEDKLKKDGYDVGVIHGGISAGKRTEIFNAFQTTKSPWVLLIQPAAASHGVTLHAANTIIWWSAITSAEIYAQANARIHRAGQKNKCLVVRIIGSSVEKKLYEALDEKEKFSSTLLDLYGEELELC